MVNTNLFKAEMIKSGFTQKSLSKAVGMSVNTLNSKLNNNGVFNIVEVEKICDIMGITDDRLKCQIFLWKPSQI